jgi:hypothetical protein
MAEPTQFPLSVLDHYEARKFVCVTVLLLTISLATVTARVIFKLRSKLLFTLDDYLIVAGAVSKCHFFAGSYTRTNTRQIFAIATWGMMLAVIGPCAPSSKSFLNLEEFDNVVKFGALSIPTDILALASIKISVACLLLRFQQNKIGKIILYALIGLLVATHATFFLFILLQCIPLAATWDPAIPGAKCVSHKALGIVSNSNTGITIATDVILSLFPITFLRQIRRPLMERALIGVLMAMGLAASGCSVAKAILVKKWATGVNSFSNGFELSMLSCDEIFLGIIAACSPCFKPTIQRLLTAMGITFSGGPRSFVERVPGTSTPNQIPSGPLQEFNTHSDGTTKSNVFNFSELEDLSKESSQVGAEGLGSRSEEERHLSRGSDRIQGPDDIV